MRWSRKGSTQTALQKAYDEAYANSLNSILLETNNQSDEALVAWTTTLEGIARNIGELDAAATPKSSAEKSLMANLLDIERQCHDRISYLESRRDSVGSYQSPPKVPPYSAQSAMPGQYGGYAHSSDEDLRPYNPYHSNSSLQLSAVPPTPPPHTVGSASNVSLHATTVPSARHQYSGSVGSAEAYGSLLSANSGPNGPNTSNTNNMYNMKARSASELMAASNAGSSQGPKKMLETLRSSSGGRARGSNASRGRTAHSGLQAAALAWGDTGGGSSSSSSSAQQAQQAQQARTSSLGSNNGGFDKMSMRGAGYGFRSRPAAGSGSTSSQAPPQLTRSPFDDNSQLLVDLESSDSDRASPPQDSAPRPSRSAPPPRPPKPASLPRTIKLEHAHSSSTVPTTARAPSPPKGISPKETVALAATAMKNAKPATKLQPAVTLAQMRQHQQAIQSQAARAQPRPQGRWVITSTTPKQGARGTSPSKPTQSPQAQQAAKSRPKQQRAASPEPEPESESPPNEEDEWMKMAREKIKGLRGVDPQAAEQILNEIVHHGDEVRWEDIAGLERAKASLKETVVYPFLRPDLFSGLREPAQGMLLFGPPGTGKTMLARAVATESKSTFFSISASSLTSKFLGESEKLVRALFQMARALAPSIIFVDEIDSLLSSRSEGGEHEASRRIKTEFLVQWSDLQHAAAGKAREDLQRVLVLAATNLPWAIDEAARRRFVRRQYIPLPERTTREVHIKKLLAHQKHAMSESDFGILLDMTDGFSGSDMTALAKDAAMGPLRALGEALLTTPTDQIRPMGLEDFIESLKTIRPSVSREGLKAFEDWATMYGSSGA